MSASRKFPALTVQQLKRYGYSAMIGLAILSMGTVLLFGSPSFTTAPATKTFNNYVYPVFMLLGVGTIWAILRGLIPIEKIEKPIIALGFTFVAVKFSLTVLSAVDLLSMHQIESWYWMIAGFWIGAFLAFNFLPALIMNFVLYILTTGVTLVDAILRTDGPVMWDTLSNIAASNLRFSAALVAIIILGYVKCQWVYVEKEAMMLRSMAHEDALTGLPNRRWLSGVLQDAVENAKDKLTVILFDLDGFKRVNDNFGHSTGDDVLREIGGLAEHCVRTADTIGRWGGEEFLVVCPDTTLVEGVHLAERLRHMLATHPMQHGQPITGSFGVAQWQRGESPEQLVARADAALYAAKEQGKNQVCSSLVDDGFSEAAASLGSN